VQRPVAASYQAQAGLVLRGKAVAEIVHGMFQVAHGAGSRLR